MSNSGQVDLPGKHIQLMVEWAGDRTSGRGRFISDGPISWEDWLQAEHRLVFLMKEAYDTDLESKWKDPDYQGTTLSGAWTLSSLVRELFLEGDWKPRTWQNLALWADAMHCFELGAVPVHEISQIDDVVLSSLRKSAVINLKKYDGQTRSDEHDLREHLRATSGSKTNAQLLAEQLRILRPDWIVCCGTFGLLKDELGEELGLSGTPSRKAWGVEVHEGTTWYDYWHPAWQTSPFLLVNGLHSMRAAVED